MDFASFFNSLFWFIICLVACDCIFLDGFFSEAIATRIRGGKNKDSEKD